MAKKSTESTNLPLIISLVFFVLTTIGFGVMWYMAYSEQETHVANVKKEKADADVVRKLNKEQELSARVYRIAMGIDDADDKEKLLAEVKAGDKASAELKKINEAFEKKGGGAEYASLWPVEADGKIGTPPPKGLVDLAIDATAAKKTAVDQAKKDRESYAGAIRDMGAASVAFETARKLFAASAISLPEDFQKKMQELEKMTVARHKAFIDAEADSRKTNGEKADLLVANERERKIAQDKNDKMKKDLEELASQLAGKEDASKFETPLGKVLRRYQDGTVEIDFGSDAMVKPGLKFTVLPSDYPQKGEQSRMMVERKPDSSGIFRGKAQWRAKANIEVVEVKGPNLSICKLILMHAGDTPGGQKIERLEYDDIRDRVIAGDLIYHEYWKKGTADHIALVGQFDTNGDGTDDIEAVVRDFRAMGIPVDAWYDMRTQKWEGKLTPRTRTLIYGEFPINSGTDPNRDAKTALTTKLFAAIDEAKQKGIKAEPYGRVFPKMGYYARVPLPEDKINQATTRYLNTAPPPETPPGTGN